MDNKQLNRLKLQFERGEITALRYYRLLAGLEIEQLATKIGEPPRTIFKLETKRVKFPKHLANKLAEALGVETERLFDGLRH